MGGVRGGMRVLAWGLLAVALAGPSRAEEPDDSETVMRFLQTVEAHSLAWDVESASVERQTQAALGSLIGSVTGGSGVVGGLAGASGIGQGGLLSAVTGGAAGGGDFSGIVDGATNAAGVVETAGSFASGGGVGELGIATAVADQLTGGQIGSTVAQYTGTDMSSSSSTNTPSNTANLPSINAPLTSNCGSPMLISVKSLAEYRVYVDGVQVGYSQGVQHKVFNATYGSSGAVTIAIEATRDRDLGNFADVDGISMNVTVCGNLYVTDHNWQCVDTRPWNSAWRVSDYIASNWGQARMVRDDEWLMDGTKSYNIWSKACSSSPVSFAPETAYCRVIVKPVTCTKPACYAAAAPSVPADSCLSGCDAMVSGMSECDAINYRLTKGCTSCSTPALNNYKTWCKTRGCTAAQCSLSAEPAPVPSMTCLSACTQGMSQINGVCKQQAYQFQSGCSATCGAEVLAYARDYCVQTLGCKSVDCQLFNTTMTNSTVVSGPTTPRQTIPPTPDLTCFFRCLSGMNKYESYCDKIHYAITSGCAACPDSTMAWARTSCLTYVDEVTGQQCTAAQCT